MRPISSVAVFVAHIVVGIFAFAPSATAATFFVNLDTTIATDITGDESLATPDDQNGVAGGAAIDWDANGVDVIINSGLTMTGGAGGPGGADTTDTGGNIAGFGGAGVHMGFSTGTLTGSGVFIYGGAGGAGGNGGSAGASDTSGGFGANGGAGIAVYPMNTDHQISLSDSTIQGGQGGSGGDAGDASGDAADNAEGGGAGDGGAGFHLEGSIDATFTLNNVTIKGGNGGVGGASLANAANADGGAGGTGFVYFGDGVTFTFGTGTLVQGGIGGAAGTGGTGGAKGSDGRGFLFGGLNGVLTNHGTIKGGGDAAAIWVLGTVLSIDNFGAIGSAAGHSGSALGGPGSIGTFTNHAGASILSSGSSPTALVDGGVGTFLNQGTITNTGSGNALVLLGPVTNFSNSGAIHATSGSGLVLFGTDVEMPDVITNTGGMISSGGSNAAVAILSDLGTNGVTIDGGQVTANVALRVVASQTGATTLKNTSVTGNIIFFQADETLNLAGATLNGSDVLFAGGTNNNLNFESGVTTLQFGTQIKTPGSLLFNVLDGGSVVTNTFLGSSESDILKVTVVAGGNLLLNVGLWVDDQVFNQGTIEIAAGQAITANEFAGNGKYVFNFNGFVPAKIEVQGAFSKIDLTGATIEMKLSDPSAMLATGSNYLLAEDLSGNDVLGVTNGSLALDNSALLNFLLYRGDAAEIGLTSDLLFAQVQIALLADIAGEGDDPNSIALGAALDAIGLDGDADIDDLMLALALLPTNADINEVLDALLPETDGIGYDIATDLGDQVLDIASKRLDGLRGTQMAGEYKLAGFLPIAMRGSIDETRRGAGRFWLQAFGRAVDQGRHSFNTGYDAGSYGFAGGADIAVSQSTQLGGAFSYASTDADGNGVNLTDTQVDSYQLTLYGDHLFDNAVYAKGLFAYGWHENDIARHNVGGILGNTATGGYDASQFNLRAEVGRAYVAGRNLALIPRATLAAAWYSPDGYTEQGVGGLGLTVAPDDLASVRLGLGVLARWNVQLSGGELFQPELRLDYRRDLTRERFETTSEFLGAPGIAFRTQGVEPPADILNLGVGALLATAGGVDLRASYDVELKQDYVAHAGYVRASIPF